MTGPFKKADKDAWPSNRPSHWPSPEYEVSQHGVSLQQFQDFKKLIDSEARETDIEDFLADNQAVLSLTLSLFSTGHHRSWIFPKQHIRPASGEIGGMIPDYVLAGANSDGVSWWVLELKGPNQKAFVTRNKRIFLSSEANRGVCQLMSYIDVSTRSQSYLRDELKLSGYREPKGILLIGNGDETEQQTVRDFKATWNRMAPSVQIVSYRRLLHIVESKLEAGQNF
jgi:hypothetical protein